MSLPLALDRFDVAHYVATLFTVYSLLIFAYIIVQLAFSFGMRMPYSRASNAVLEFLRDTCEPYLRIFRRFLPSIGPFDISPIVAVLVLQIVARIVVAAIQG